MYVVRRDAHGADAVLLGRKKTGLGTGKLVGLGGKLEPDENPEDAAVREALEEAGITIDRDHLRAAGTIDYPFPTKPEWSQRSHVFVCERWAGEPSESDELAPEWFARSSIPFDLMWDDARQWLPDVLAGGNVAATFIFGDDLNTVVGAE